MPQDNGPTARLPKGSLSTVQAATRQALDNLGPNSVMPYKALSDDSGTVVSSTPKDRADAAVEGAKSAWWLTTTGPDGRPMLRAIDPHTSQPVQLANGKTLDLPIQAQQAQQSPSQRQPIPAAPNAPPLPKGVYRLDEAVRRGAKQPPGGKLPVAR